MGEGLQNDQQPPLKHVTIILYNQMYIHIRNLYIVITVPLLLYIQCISI